jgi:hypothetical protein
MADDVHFIGVASAKLDGDFAILRLAASDGKAYTLRLTDAATRGIVQSLQVLIPLQRTADRTTLQVSRSQPLQTADGRKAIELEFLGGTIAFEFSGNADIELLQRQLASLLVPPESTLEH